MEKEAYLAGALNAAILLEDNSCSFLRAGVDADTPIDGYLYSQLRAIKPELKKITYESKEELEEKVFIENIHQRALNQALELMDHRLSDNYRQKIAAKLISKLDIHNGLSDFLMNRLYSRILPKTFDPELALKAIGGNNENLVEIYKNLHEKSSMFGRFYTMLRMLLPINAEEMEEIDTALSDSSAYANFTLALYTRSYTLYKFAVSLSLEHVKHSLIDGSLFETIKKKLGENYGLLLKSSERVNICDRSKHVSVLAHRFYGSPLKTMFNYYQDHLPFSSNQVIDVVARNLFYHKGYQETRGQYLCRLYDQSVDELQLLQELRAVNPNEYLPGMGHMNGLKAYIDSAKIVSSAKLSYPAIDIKYPEVFAGILFGDDLFLNHHYRDAILVYSDIILQITPDRRKASYLSDLFIYITTNVKIGIVYEKLDQGDLAKQIFHSVQRKMSRYATVATAQVENEKEDEFSPSNSTFIHSLYDNLNRIITDTDTIRP